MNIKPISKRHYIMQQVVILHVFQIVFQILRSRVYSLELLKKQNWSFIIYLMRFQMIIFISRARNNTLHFQVVKDTVKQNESAKWVMATFAGEVEKLHLKQRRCQNIMSAEGMNRYVHNEGMIHSSIKFRNWP